MMSACPRAAAAAAAAGAGAGAAGSTANRRLLRAILSTPAFQRSRPSSSSPSPLPDGRRRRLPCRIPASQPGRAGVVGRCPVLFLPSSVPRPQPTTTAAAKRGMSSYEWKNMSEQAQKANKDFAELTKQEIRKAGEAEIDKVEKALKAMEPFNDVFEVKREGLEVFAELGPEVGTYWIKFDLSIYQICLMSPRSGPHRYIYDKESGRWIGEADKHDFQGMLTGDIIQSACGVPDF
eukprot:g15041.t2